MSVIITVFFVGWRLAAPVSKVAGHYASYFIYPVLKIQNNIVTSIKALFRRRRTIADLTDELEKLRKSNDALQEEIISLKGQIAYFGDIKELTEFKRRYDRGIACVGQILFSQFSSEGHYLLVDKGSSTGIKTDMIALYNNCLIGRVSEVYPWYCKVITITDAGCKIAAYCDRSHSYGIHEGCNALDITLIKRISHLSNIQERELILSSGEGLVFPRGFGLGRIKTFAKRGLWYEVSVEPLIDIKKLSYCILLHKEAVS